MLVLTLMENEKMKFIPSYNIVKKIIVKKREKRKRMSNSKSTTKNNKDNILNSRKLYCKKKDIGIRQKVCYSGNTASKKI